MKVTVCFFLLLFQEIFSINYGCIVWRNSYLYYKNETTLQNQTEFLKFNFYKSPRKGDFGVGFSHTKSFQDIKLSVHFTSNGVFFYSNHTNNNQTLNVTSFKDESAFYKIDNIYYANFNMEMSYFESFRYIFFTEMEQSSHLVTGWKESPIFEEKSNFNDGWCTPNYLGLPGRLFSTWWFTYIPYICFGILLIGLCIYYRNTQPLKSRGEFGPILTIIVSMLNLTTDFTTITFFTFEQFYYFDCFINTFLIYPTIMLMIPISLFYYLKFIILVNVNAKKFQLANSNTRKSLPIFYRLLLKITTIESFIIWYITFLSIYYILILINFGIFGYKCGTLSGSIGRIIYFIMALPLFLIICFLIIWDLIQNYKLIFKCKLREFYFVTDHFFFRLIFLAAPIEIVVLVVWILPISYPSMFRNALIEVGFGVAILINALLPLGFSIVSKLFEKKLTKETNELEELFKTEEIYALFLEFSRNEWSMENVICQKLILNYKSSLLGRKKYVNEIYYKFLKGEIFELNITEERKKHLIFEIDKIQNDIYPNDFFDGLEQDLRINLSDIYARFMFTDEYQGYKSKSQSFYSK